MAEHFGVKYEVRFNACSELETIRPYDFIGNPHIDLLNTFYIHPDSLHIFESQVGDLMMWESKLSGILVGFADKLLIEALAHYSKQTKFQHIIQRNNKHFFMPEVEA